MICSPFEYDKLRNLFFTFMIENKKEEFITLPKLAREVGVSYIALNRFLKKNKRASQQNMVKMIRFIQAEVQK